MTSSAYQRAFQALLTALAYGSISPKDPPVPGRTLRSACCEPSGSRLCTQSNVTSGAEDFWVVRPKYALKV